MKFGLLLILSALFVGRSGGQTRQLNGIVTNSNGVPLQGVSVTIRVNDSSKIVGFAISRVKGDFLIGSIPADMGKLAVEFRHLGFETQKMWIDKNSWPAKMNIVLVEKATELTEIVVKRELPVLIRTDTVVFNANSYRDAEVRKVEDLLKKMQGFSVDPSGRLMFNGRPVEKVLIDGDDLAGQGYQMITKNLDAITIDKVEVINNFSDNRLLRDVVETGKVGVNLKISSRFRSRLSGSTENGMAPERRYSADMNAIYIEKAMKWLAFGSVNNVARDVSGNARYYYEQEGGQMNGQESPIGTVPLEAGSIIMPVLGDRYIRDNRDFGSAVMNTWKLGKHIRINGMLGYDDLRHGNMAGSLVETELNDQDQWRIFSDMVWTSGSKDLIGRFSLQRDAGRNQVSRFELVVNIGKQEFLFNSKTTGDVSDSLNEFLSNRSTGLRFKGEQAWLLRDKVLQLNLGFDLGELGQNMAVHSSRFLAYWKLDSMYQFNRQHLDKDRSRKMLQLKVNGRSKRVQYEYGVTLEGLKIRYRTETNVSSRDVVPGIDFGKQMSRVSDASLKASGKLLFEVNSVHLIGISMNTGVESLDTGLISRDLLVYESSLWYIRKLGLLNSLRINYKVGRGFKKYDHLHPDQLISGSATILNGLKFSDPEISQGVMASYNSINLNKQKSWSASFSYNYATGRYVNSYDLYPEYTVQYFEFNGFNGSFNAGLNGETYVRLVKSKLGGMVSFISLKERNTVNSSNGISVRNNLRIEGWMVSGFHFPFNIELRAGAFYSTGRWTNGPPNKLWQGFWSCKLKIRSGQKFYSSGSLTVRDLSGAGKFFGFDFFASYKLNPTVLFSLNGVNLLNVQRVADVSVMPYSRSEAIFRIVPRYLLASVNVVF